MSPLVITLLCLVIFFAVELLFTPFNLGNNDKKDKSSTFYVLGIPLITGIICGIVIFASSSVGHAGWWNFAGLALMCAGIIIRVIAKQELGEHFAVRVTIKKDHKLVTSGIYSLIRHPLYFGILLVYASFPLLLGLWWVALLFTVPSAISIFARVNVEEKALSDFFGKAWQKHVKKTIWFY